MASTKGIRGVRLDPKHQERTRNKIKVSELVTRLQANSLGMLEHEMTQGQIASARILLDKALPNLTAQELSGGVAQYVARLPQPAASAEAWAASIASEKATEGQGSQVSSAPVGDSGKVH